VKNDRIIRESVARPQSPDYVGVSEFCGVLGKATVTDRFVSEPRFGSDARGEYVEVRSLLGSRLGAFIPDIDVGVSSVFPFGGLGFGLALQQFIEEVTEDLSEEGYTGTNTSYPKIFSYIKLRVYADGGKDGEFVSNTAGNGFLDQDEIVKGEIGYSWIPEHYLYLDDRLVDNVEIGLSDSYERTIAWIDTNLPYEEFAFLAVQVALNEFCASATQQQRDQLARDFAEQFPDYFAGKK
jgi:hypothetical protein